MMARPAIAALLVLALFGCAPAGTAAPPANGQPVAKIVVLSPFSGALATQGVGIRNAVDLAVRQANQRQAVPGWRLEVVAEDDAATPTIGAEAASTVASDPAVLAVVGPLNSGVAQEVLPVLDWAGVGVVSPGNTSDTLTRGSGYLDRPARPHDNYFRVSTLDSLQGRVAADYAFHTVGARKVAVIHDKKTYGQGIAATFSDRFTQDGGHVVSTQAVNAGDKDYTAVVATTAAAHPDLIFYGGEFPEAGLLSKQAKQIGLGAPLMGGDGMKDSSYTTIAGAASEGDLATSVGASAETLGSAQSFIRDYHAAGYLDGYASYGAAAFDAANAIIAALAKILPGHSAAEGGTRRAVIDALAATNFTGVTGRVAFDQYGDNVTRLFTVFKVANGVFVAQQTTAYPPDR